MTPKTIDCADCGASVPYGRLSCPSCGSLLASVTGGGRPIVVPEPDEPEAMESLLLSDDDPPWASSPLVDVPKPVLAGRPYRRALVDDPRDTETLAPPPGAYRPSTLSMSGAVAAASHPATATIQIRIGALQPAHVIEIAGWFVVVGAAMAILGFFLPWSSVVIGAGRGDSYFDTWGLGSPTHMVVLAATMLVLALGIVRTSVPVWVRSGVLPLVLGSLLIGLAWPYQIGPLGADVGILVMALGGLCLAVGGVLGSWSTRHGGADPAV